MSIVKIFVDGHVDDLYALSLLFPQGAHPDLFVISGIKGEKDGPMDRVTDPRDRRTYVSGDGCLPILDARGYGAGWVARRIVAPLNGFAALADSAFRPAEPVGAEFPGGGMTFGGGDVGGPRRLIAVARHPSIAAARDRRVGLIGSDAVVAHAVSVIAGPPNWADYYRVLEDVADYAGTSIDKLSGAGLAGPHPLKAFTKAANNHVTGRHGASKRDATLDQSDLMTLNEARQFVRDVVSGWLDGRCGDRMPTDRVDGGPLRFGLDPRD